MASEGVPDLVDRVAGILVDRGRTVGVAESLTCGKLASALGAGPDAGTWFRGGVVAYAPEVKFDLLGVTPGPVHTARCARELATGAVKALGADLAVAATGVGGPDPEDGLEPGTVFIASATTAGPGEVVELDLDGSPEEILDATVLKCLQLLLRELAAEPVSPPAVGSPDLRARRRPR